jgi:4-amino-4-deoxy-L-arabinose transferase-like glycosyltransferase
MKYSQGSSQKLDKNYKKWKNALIGYQTAIDLWTYQGEQVWARFNIMLVANSIVVTAIVLTISSQKLLPIFTKLLALIGFILCLFWYLLIKRESEYADYYINSARELEEQYLAPIIKTVSRGASFANGNKITLKINKKEKELQMSRMARFRRTKDISFYTIWLFIFLYITIIILQNMFIKNHA